MPTRIFRAQWIWAVVIGGMFAPWTQADEPLPPDRPIAEVIDHYLDLKLKTAKVAPAPQATDATLVRRLYLDLAGRIPTPNEARYFVKSTDPHKRAKLIQELVTSPEFIRHSATEFDVFLRNDNTEAGSVRGYLLNAFQENRPWDQMFRDLLGVAEKPDPAKPEQYVTKRLKDRDSLTRDISSVFFGLNVSCAQCHRHPYIKSLTQDYFFGMREFFASAYDFQGNLLDRKFTKPAEFKAKDGKILPVKMMFLNGKTVERENIAGTDLAKAIQEESKEIEKLAKAYPKTKELPPASTFRPRSKLAELALAPENRAMFAKAIVNRLWYRFYGYGLVMRTDQMHANNPASHPDLLQWLTRDFIAHQYDLKRLIGGLVASKAYARSSQWDDKEAPAPQLFAVAAIRPLTPSQWAISFSLANNPSLLKQGLSREMREKSLVALESQSKGLENLIEYPREDMQIPITESLKLSNDAAILKSVGGQLLPVLMKSKDRKQQIEESVWTVLSRAPTSDDYEVFDSYLENRKDRPVAGLQQMIWALINSPEFRFNH
ncbi:MAG: DUF1549 domain-containing protein [Gemmataceae bacterium]|nr:DUF1549 domain-containing protein [Gemmataceae bacterium]